MPYKGSIRRRSTEEYRNANALARQILNHPRLKSKLYRKFNNRPYSIEVEVITVENNNTPKEVIQLKPVKKKRLTVEEKLALSKKLAGSAKLFSYQGIEDAIKIANREYDQEEED
jgi:hypothetical protein